MNLKIISLQATILPRGISIPGESKWQESLGHSPPKIYLASDGWRLEALPGALLSHSCQDLPLTFSISPQPWIHNEVKSYTMPRTRKTSLPYFSASHRRRGWKDWDRMRWTLVVFNKFMEDRLSILKWWGNGIAIAPFSPRETLYNHFFSLLKTDAEICFLH